jgi:hypothetical protein
MLHKCLAVIMLLVSSGCVALTPAVSPLTSPTAISSPISAPPSPISPTSNRTQTLEPATAVQRAIQDLAARLNIDAGEITVDSITSIEITLPDTSCAPDQNPQPNIPAQVIGQEIILSVRNQTYTYHARGAKVMLCTAQTK